MFQIALSACVGERFHEKRIFLHFLINLLMCSWKHAAWVLKRSDVSVLSFVDPDGAAITGMRNQR